MLIGGGGSGVRVTMYIQGFWVEALSPNLLRVLNPYPPGKRTTDGQGLILLQTD